MVDVEVHRRGLDAALIQGVDDDAGRWRGLHGWSGRREPCRTDDSGMRMCGWMSAVTGGRGLASGGWGVVPKRSVATLHRPWATIRVPPSSRARGLQLVVASNRAVQCQGAGYRADKARTDSESGLAAMAQHGRRRADMARPRRTATVTIQNDGGSPGRRALPDSGPRSNPGPDASSPRGRVADRRGPQREAENRILRWVFLFRSRANSAPSSYSAPTNSADRCPWVVSPYASPVLVLVAALAILEGYRWLKVLPPDELPLSAAVFAAIAVPLSIWVTDGGLWGRRMEARAMSGASLLLIAVTVIALGQPRSPRLPTDGIDGPPVRSLRAGGRSGQRAIYRQEQA